MKHLTGDLGHSSLGFWFWFWLKSDIKVLDFSLINSMCVYLASDSRFLIFPYFFSFNFCQETSCVKKFLAKKLPGSLASALKFFLISTPEFFLSGFCILIGNVQFSHSVVSDSLWPHELQHARPPYPSPLPELTQTHVHWVSDAIQPSHPLSSPSPPALNLSQHQGLFRWVSSSNQVAKVLEFELQHQSFQWTPRTGISL